MISARDLPVIIQGGMGIGVSGWRLARSVSVAGGLGVVSGTAIDTVLVRRLQLGDEGGHVRRALAAFPHRPTAERILGRYFVEGGIAPDAPFRLLPLPSRRMNTFRQQLLVAANFVEVYLAKEAQSAPVGINYLEKIQLPTLPSLYGALLAGVDVVLMGAGIPSAIPKVLDALVAGQNVELKLQVEDNARGETFTTVFSGRDVFGRDILADVPTLRPRFLPIVSSHILAKTLARKASGGVDGFVVETHEAGGHNAPPRKARGALESEGPWGPLDAPDLSVMAELGLPFWLAGGRASAERLREARQLGAHGIQVGTAFAYCEESGISSEVKRRTLARCRSSLRVVTDFEASPTGYPFKLLVDDDDPGEVQRHRDRQRVCDLGYLRQNYVDANGQVGYRCPGEPVETYVKKGGQREATRNKMCLCNGLMATVGLGQRRDAGSELAMYTAGDDLTSILRFVPAGATSYAARDVLRQLQEDLS